MKRYANGAWQSVWENYYAKFSLDRGEGFNGFVSTLDSYTMFLADGNQVTGRIRFGSPRRCLIFWLSVPYTSRDVDITYEFDFQGDGFGTTYALDNFQQSVFVGVDRSDMKLLSWDYTYEINEKHQKKGTCIMNYFLGSYQYIGLLFSPGSGSMETYGGLTFNFQLSNFWWNGKRIGFETDSH